jgi:hypothetical protein
MKRTTEEFNYIVEVGRDRPSTKFSGPLGSGESHGMAPVMADPVATVLAIILIVTLFFGGFAILATAGTQANQSHAVPAHTGP